MIIILYALCAKDTHNSKHVLIIDCMDASLYMSLTSGRTCGMAVYSNNIIAPYSVYFTIIDLG